MSKEAVTSKKQLFAVRHCPHCKQAFDLNVSPWPERCEYCDGSGHVEDHWGRNECPDCSGTGFVHPCIANRCLTTFRESIARLRDQK